MKYVFAALLLIFGGLYAVAELTIERPPDDGVVRLRWSTDANPARQRQVDLFARMSVQLKPDQVLDYAALCAAIHPSPDSPPASGVARRLWNLLDDDGRATVSAIAQARSATPKQEAALVQAINQVMENPALHDHPEQDSIQLTKSARDVLDRSAETDSEKLTRTTIANRLILENAFSQYIRPAHRIEVTVDSGDTAKLIIQCVHGVGPDIIDMYDNQSMASNVEAGILLDLTDDANRMGFGVNDTYPAIRDALMIDGRQYRFPCNVWANTVIYNKDIFRICGVPEPDENWDFDQFVAAAVKIRDYRGPNGQKYIPIANWYNLWMFEDLLIGSGGSFFHDQGLRSALNAPPSLQAAQTYQDMMYRYRIIPTPAEATTMSGQGGWGTGGAEWFYSEKAAMIIIGRWYIVQVPQYPNLKGKLGNVLLPRLDGRKSQGMTDGRAAGINAETKYPEEAKKFLQYLASPQYNRLIIEDGDALPPSPAMARTGADLVNKIVPDPAFHQPFIDAVANARPLDLSAFIDMGMQQRWIIESLEKIENREDVKKTMDTLASDVNHQIRINIERRPDLQRLYERLTDKPYDPDWWRSARNATAN